MSYFDNGEEFEGDSDDNMDEAIYWNTEHTSDFIRQHSDTFYSREKERNRPAAVL